MQNIGPTHPANPTPKLLQALPRATPELECSLSASALKYSDYSKAAAGAQQTTVFHVPSTKPCKDLKVFFGGSHLAIHRGHS